MRAKRSGEWNSVPRRGDQGADAGIDRRDATTVEGEAQRSGRAGRATRNPKLLYRSSTLRLCRAAATR